MIVNGISGKDIGVIMANDKLETFKDIFQNEIYYEKSSKKELSEKEYWNDSIRQMCINEFTVRTGKKTRRESKVVRDKEYNFMIGNIDRKVSGENSILIFENYNRINVDEMKGKIGREALVFLICQHNIRIYECEKCYLILFINYEKMIIKEIIRNEKIINMLINIEEHFWNDYKNKYIKESNI